MNRRERKAAKLRDKADRLDPGGMLVPAKLSITVEKCCGTMYNPDGIGTPLYWFARDQDRAFTETTAQPNDDHPHLHDDA